ncbi:Orf protein [Lactobacillus helveticus CIRM-BIA 101]|uniref:Orf protein n=1 Tax=Lactobacillus helveticus TaxID=1587 RepID=Q48563_LACHE|nr:hypothetical protein [Lactobacillus helveticus]EEW67452.1 hypothetical protein HMPREF0518_1596 [Lactobacillus helveticus DSM 20075 = CGMCC 1.1877]KGL03282.1 hypothetical protein NB98_09050 [Lactobacillus helveticus]KGL04946.1 hypothetical protein MZ90_09120 [Lactobacillus helveticus]MCT3393476.1 hypothetical protein [Lactobacillus helveticus]MCT3423543.1 hypothetical protein [Lactobacillus helveticus]
MSKTVREIAELMGIPSDDLVKEKQRIRDEIKRQNIETKKSGNKFVIADSDVEKITSALKEKLDKEDSKKKEDNEELLQMIEQLKAENSKFKSENKEKDEELVRINLKKDEEIRRLNSKIEKYADDFKEFNDKQLQLNNQQQQLQARILEQTKQLKDTQQRLLTSAEKSSELQNKVDKIENASLWQRITRKFD